MLFTTPEFIIFFVCVLAVISAIKFRRFQHLFIVGSSYFFFYFSNNYLITLLIFSTLLDFYVGKAIYAAKDKKRKKILLISSLAGNLGLLGFFKYADFAILQFNILGQELNLNPDIPFLNLALPIGISFYTFQTITYTVDIYREKLKPSDSVWEFALFVSFFPQLVAGPILRASHFLPQLREKISNNDISTRLRTITIHDTALRFGITLMAMGFFKKMFFADNVAPMVNEIFNVPYGLESFSVIIGAIAFGVQIYCDFSGYSDIAIGESGNIYVADYGKKRIQILNPLGQLVQTIDLKGSPHGITLDKDENIYVTEWWDFIGVEKFTKTGEPATDFQIKDQSGCKNPQSALDLVNQRNSKSWTLSRFFLYSKSCIFPTKILSRSNQ